MWRRGDTTNACLCALLALTSGQAVFSQQAPPRLVTSPNPVTASAGPFVEPQAPNLEAGRVDRGFSQLIVGLPDHLELEVNTARLRIEKSRTQTRGAGNVTWIGNPRGRAGSVVLTVVNNVLFGRLEVEGIAYAIEPSATGYSIMPERPQFAGSLGEDTRFPPAANVAPPPVDYAEGDGTRIDLLVLYTSQLYSRYTTSLPAMVQHYVDVANTAYQNSGINTQLRLVGLQPYAGTGAMEGTDVATALGFVTDDAFAVGLRDTYRADMVSLMRLFQDSACGCGWVMNSVSPWFADYAFTVVEVRPLSDANPYYCSDTTLAHELGHNMGCAHDRDHATGPGAYSYSYGYDIPGTFATIMSYDSPEILYFSTPLRTYSGHAIGVPEGQPDSADNARTINQTRVTVSNFRLAVEPDVSITKSHVGLFVAGSQGQYSLVVQNVGSQPTTSPITVTDTLPAGLTYAGATGSGWDCGSVGQTVQCSSIQTLAPGASSTVTLSVTVGGAAVPEVTNTATVSCADDLSPTNNSSSDLTTVQLGSDWTVGGYLGVGTDSPQRAVHLFGANAIFRLDRSADTAAFLLVRTDTQNNPLKSFVVGANASGSNQGEFIINDLGTAVGAVGSRRMTITNSGATVFGGNLLAQGYIQTSSLRLKTNLRLLDDPIGKINQLDGVRFTWRGSRKPSLGVIAEDVARVLPELVQHASGGAGTVGVSYDGLLAVLVEASKVQNRQIQELRAKRDRLLRLLDSLRADDRAGPIGR